MYYLTKAVNIPPDSSESYVKAKICKTLRIKEGDLKSYSLRKRSIDARDKSNVRFVCSYAVETDKIPQNATPYCKPVNVLDRATQISEKKRCAVVGSGPAGLFAALYLAKCGVKVVVIERGSDIDKRKSKVEEFFGGGSFDENCNVQYGLGGAGTFSDGKLTSGISSPLTYTVFEQFVRSGAPNEILTDALPHIGTDKLVNVVAEIRDELRHYGAEFRFDTAVCDLIVENGKVLGAETVCAGKTEKISADFVILACGHSAKDLFHVVVKHGGKADFKPFAVGLRVEHGREFINRAQYGEIYATHRDFGAASYKLVNQCPDGRGCYSFCMCPGGIVVPSNSECDRVAVNGMSNFDRAAENSNSALVVTVSQKDVLSYGFGGDSFAGVRFIEYLEKRAYELGGGGYAAPCQNVTDFKKRVLSKEFSVSPSYPRGVKSADLFGLLPKEISEDIALSLDVFDRKIKGFGSCGTLTGVETRTSSPVKIVRGNDYQSNLENLYPIGEGAGYAGGIVSSAVDGLKVAVSIVQKIML